MQRKDRACRVVYGAWYYLVSVCKACQVVYGCTRMYVAHRVCRIPLYRGLQYAAGVECDTKVELRLPITHLLCTTTKTNNNDDNNNARTSTRTDSFQWWWRDRRW